MKYQNIPIKDSLFLSPIEKYKIYGRFPWKMIIHILLVISTCIQILLMITTTTQYTRAQERLFYNNFVIDSDKTALDYPRTAYLYTIEELKNHIVSSIRNYYSFQNNSLENVEYMEDPKNISIFMEFNYLDNRSKLSSMKTTTIPRAFVYKVNSTYYGPFSYPDEDLKAFLNSAKEFRLNYTVKTFIPYTFDDHFECFYWKIIQTYSFAQRAHFVVKLQINRKTCEEKSGLTLIEFFIARLLWIHILVLVLACASLILTWKYIYKIAKLFWRVKTIYKKEPPVNPGITTVLDCDTDTDQKKNNSKWSQIKSQDKKKFFNMWSVVCIIGNVAQIFGAGISLFDTDNTMSSTEVLVGIGCMLSFINIGRYLEYIRDYSTIFATIKRALPNVLRYLLGVMPIFFGFIFFGLCVFWRSERFVSTSSVMISLFAMMNGDSVYDIFSDLTGVSFFLGQCYCYIFCVIFIVVVMNVFISIIEEAYVSSKMKNQNHWIYSYLKIDPNYAGEFSWLEEDKKTSAEPQVEKQQITKGQRKICEIVKSKNILRDAMTMKGGDEKKQKIDQLSKKEIESMMDNCSTNIATGLDKTEGIAKEIIKSSDTHLKDELRLYILDHISSLENRLVQLKKIWKEDE